jgi:hypothetical protein
MKGRLQVAQILHYQPRDKDQSDGRKTGDQNRPPGLILDRKRRRRRRRHNEKQLGTSAALYIFVGCININTSHSRRFNDRYVIILS